MADAIIVVVLVVIIIIAVKGSVKHFKGQGGCCGGGDSTPVKIQEKELDNPGIGELEVHISGMHCDHCVSSITKALDRLDGVSAKVSLKKNLAVISYDRQISEAEITRVIENAGFHVTEIHKKDF